MTVTEPVTYRDRMRAAQRQILLDALDEHRGNRTYAARALGIQRTYFTRLLREHGLFDHGREPRILPAVAIISAVAGGA